MSDSRIHIPGDKRFQPISRSEAANLAAQVGQTVYDQVAAEHKASIALLLNDLNGQLNQIRHITATNINDLQRRSFGFNVAYDLKRARRQIEVWYRALRMWGDLPLVEDDGVIGGIVPDPPLEPDGLNVGAPSELPSQTEDLQYVIQSESQAVDRQDEGSGQERIDGREEESAEGSADRPGLARIGRVREEVDEGEPGEAQQDGVDGREAHGPKNG